MAPGSPPSSFVRNCAIVLGAALLYLFLTWRPKRTNLNLPVVGKNRGLQVIPTLVEGTKRYPDQPWVLPLNHPVVILPYAWINDIRNHSQLSISDEAYKRFFGQYSLVGQIGDLILSVLKVDLPRGLPEIFNSSLITEAEVTLAKELGISREWTEFPVFEKVIRMYTTIAGRLYLGTDVCRDEEWIDASIHSVMDGFHAAAGLAAFPPRVLRLVAAILPAIRSLKKNIGIMASKADYLVKAHLQSHASGKYEPDLDGPSKLISWLSARYRHSGSADQLSWDYVLTVGATIAPPAGLMTHVLFELARRPEIMEDLRDEISKVVGAVGKFSYASLAILPRMDSFLRETMRLNSQQLTVMTRRTLSTVTFPDGTVLPPDTSVAINNYSVNHDSRLFPEPSEFKPYRFLDQQAFGETTKGQFANATLENLNWGYGNHSCPGRSFANAVTKLLLVRLLMEYDLKLTNAGKPENMIFDTLTAPSPDGKLLIRRRETSVHAI